MPVIIEHYMHHGMSDNCTVVYIMDAGIICWSLAGSVVRTIYECVICMYYHRVCMWYGRIDGRGRSASGCVWRWLGTDDGWMEPPRRSVSRRLACCFIPIMHPYSHWLYSRDIMPRCQSSFYH